MMYIIFMCLFAALICFIIFKIITSILEFLQNFLRQSGEITRSILIMVGLALALFIWLRPDQATAMAQNIVYKITSWFAPPPSFENDDEILSL